MRTTGSSRAHLCFTLSKPIPHPACNWGSCIDLSGRTHRFWSLWLPLWGLPGCQPGRDEGEEVPSLLLLCHLKLCSRGVVYQFNNIFTFTINNRFRNTGGWEGAWGGLDQPETSDRVRETQEDYQGGAVRTSSLFQEVPEEEQGSL